MSAVTRSGSKPETADTVLLNGFIYTMEQHPTAADAIAIRDGKIMALSIFALIRSAPTLVPMILLTRMVRLLH